MWLRVDVGTTEKLTGSIDCSLFDDIDKFAAAMKSISRVTLQGFVRHRMRQCVQHRAADDVFRCDQFDLRLLPVKLVIECIPDQRVGR